MDISLAKQTDLTNRLNRSYTNYRKSPKERKTIPHIESRLEILESLWLSFQEGHIKIISGTTEAEKGLSATYFKEDAYGYFEETYIDYKTKLKGDLQALKGSASSDKSTADGAGGSGAISGYEVKLPQIKLPTFSGGYEEWQSFHDMFVSLIHTNKNLSPVQKLLYLKSSLSGEAEQLLKNLSTTDTNYEEAWKQLQGRYSNKRYNANEVMKKLFSQKSVTTESPTAIKQLLDTTSACLKLLENLKISTSSWDTIINYLVLSKLDHESRKLWELHINQVDDDTMPTWDELKKFLERRFRTLEMLDTATGKQMIKSNNSYSSSNTKQLSKIKSHHSTSTNNNEKNVKNICEMCSGQHVLYQCKQFCNNSPQERYEFVQSKALCFNCLSSKHSVKHCHQSTCCRRCGRRHHTLLHFERVSERDSAKEPAESHNTEDSQKSVEPATKVVAHFAKESCYAGVLLATAMVRVTTTNGYSLVVRALIDQGSEASFITESVAQSLGLKRVPINGLISGVGEGKARTKSMTSCKVESLHNPEFSVIVNAFVLKTLTSFLPSKEAYFPDWAELNNLPLADPKYGVPRKIEMILGADIHAEIIKEGILKHPKFSGPVAQNTQLGWILSGRVNNNTSLTDSRVVSLHIQVKEDQLLKQFWEIEREPDSIMKKFTKEEMKCEEIYEKTTIRDENGRYIVRLPFKGPNPECLYGNSKEIALRRFNLLERRLTRNPELHKEYKKVMDDYLSQDHMREITNESELNDPYVVYLPHHVILRENKQTTKARVVFDASCKGVNNVSLNDNLLVGPKLQQDLRHILMRWRRHPICIVADLVKMYRQIKVHPDDTDFQRILWREQPQEQIKHYRLLRLTFGTASAPYLAVKSLQQLAKDEYSKYPTAAKITLEDYYMDDVLTGCDTEEQALEIYEEMSKLMAAGGFELQKWCSNSDELLQFIKQENQRSDTSVVFMQNDMMKVLGISWNKHSDSFEYTLRLPDKNDKITKRKVLSDIARLYDPLGWIAPVIIRAKAFIQKLWKSGLEWDESLTPELLEEWRKYRTDLENVQSIVIPRWLGLKSNDHTELHAFADALQIGYSAVVYLKTKARDGNVIVNLVSSKTKVAPIEKEISIPRMELCAALLATKLLYEVSQIMNVPKTQLYAWSDSTVVLAWIAGEPSRWTTFVSNRVSEILTMTDREQWSHVSTNHNPADCASRGLLVAELVNHELWWHGPDWLKSENHVENTKNCSEFLTTEEQRPIKTLTAVISPKEEFIWTRFSNLSKMIKVLAYCRKFLELRLPKDQRINLSKIITAEEAKRVLKICIQATQNLYFEEEIRQLKSHGSVPKTSLLHILCPILDQNGIVRVGGRIKEADVEYNKKHPVIMPSESHLTKLLVLDAHIRTLHGGPQIMLNFLRSTYWILRARHLVKKCYKSCVTCLRYSRTQHNPFMGQLPECRVKPSRPFKTSGVDFTGHINIRFSPGRGSKSYKGYICVFICMVSKAIHLEAVSDLSAKGFIAAFKRFVSRRGQCQTLFSDNGTNFVGACKELKQMFDRSVSQLPDEIRHLLALEGTSWQFIPPHAPNFGGLWEAGVRSTKTHLKRVVGDTTLTFEELSTVLTQIEACLNSRPLSYLSDDINDALPLTPGHFLIGEPLVVIPDEHADNDNVSGMQRWKVTQKMVNDFWKRWSDEYIVTLNQRYKWTLKKNEPELNDIVIIRDHNLPPAKWLLGKIVQKHPGKDNITRVVTIKTKNGICKRPCNKLCFLPLLPHNLSVKICLQY